MYEKNYLKHKDIHVYICVFIILYYVCIQLKMEIAK